MSDLISRQAAIDAVRHAWAKGLEPTQFLEELPPAQPDVPDTNVGDMISRQTVLRCLIDISYNQCKTQGEADVIDTAKTMVSVMPSAQPEIIRCKDCRFQDKGRNESESWNLCGYRPWLHVPTEDEHYCGYAERRTE